MDILNQHLIPDLTQLVLKYCWSEKYDFYDLCFYGNYKKISTIENDDWNWGLCGACRGGHMDIVKLMIERGATDWNYGLYGACKGGHMNMVELMIERGATDWNNGLYGACRGGHMNMVELMIERGATDWNDGVYYACKGGHMDIVELMIERGATGCYCRGDNCLTVATDQRVFLESDEDEIEDFFALDEEDVEYFPTLDEEDVEDFLTLDEENVEDFSEIPIEDFGKSFHLWDGESISLVLVLSSGYHGTIFREKAIKILTNYFNWVGKNKPSLTAEHAKTRELTLKYIKEHSIQKNDKDGVTEYFAMGTHHIF